MNFLFSFTHINSYIVICLLLTILFLFYVAVNKTLQKRLILNNKYLEFEPKEEQFRIYFLFFGITIPLIESIVDVFDLRATQHLAVNFSVGGILILCYFLCSRYDFLYRHIKVIFTTFYLVYFCYIGYNLFFEPFELISYVSFIVAFFLSYFVIKNIVQYWVFLTCIFVFLFISYRLQLIESKLGCSVGQPSFFIQRSL